MQNIVNKALQSDHLVKLIQKDNFVGWTYDLAYGSAKVMTNDLWKMDALGVQFNSFLVAATFDPEAYSSVPMEEKEVILLRVVGTARLPQDDDLVRAKVDYFQQQKGLFPEDEGERDFDRITRNQMQFHGLECRVLGTFYTKNGALWLGSDLESFASASRLNVYRPRGNALQTIVNHIDPIRRRKAEEDARQLGLEGAVDPFKVGTVRYTSTDRLHRRDEAEEVPVYVQPSDFLARRTAVLGMTRTGKSNTIKQTVSVVKRVSDESGVPIGQIIYDINGEYANVNEWDRGALAEVYPGDTIRYRMVKAKGFRELQNNFYVQLTEGHSIIARTIRDNKDDGQADVKAFLNLSFDEPENQYSGDYKRWQVRSAAYQALLYRADFPAPDNHQVRFEANKDVRKAVSEADHSVTKDPKYGLTLSEAVDWFEAVREANKPENGGPLESSSSDKNWLDEGTKAILNMLVQRNQNGAYINGYKVLTDAVKYHSPRRSAEVGEEIYGLLEEGKIVILDLSVGNPMIRERISQQIARDIFNKSMQRFVDDTSPPNVVFYVEEAHNLIGKGMELTETWPRLAKEGAKYRIALVYATQEVSSVHPNILANTENWFVTHLNNEREVRELARFYDFADFSDSLIRAQDVGFARVKTLSSPFVVPVQIDKFDADAERRRMAQRSASGDGVQAPAEAP